MYRFDTVNFDFSTLSLVGDVVEFSLKLINRSVSFFISYQCCFVIKKSYLSLNSCYLIGISAVWSKYEINPRKLPYGTPIKMIFHLVIASSCMTLNWSFRKSSINVHQLCVNCSRSLIRIICTTLFRKLTQHLGMLCSKKIFFFLCLVYHICDMMNLFKCWVFIPTGI